MYRTKNGTGGKPGFFSDRLPPSPTKKSRVSFFVPHTAKRHKKVRECSVLIIFVCFVCFVVKKADGLRTPLRQIYSGRFFFRNHLKQIRNLLKLTKIISFRHVPKECQNFVPALLKNCQPKMSSFLSEKKR